MHSRDLSHTHAQNFCLGASLRATRPDCFRVREEKMSLGTRACVIIQTRKGLHRGSPKLRLHVATPLGGEGVRFILATGFGTQRLTSPALCAVFHFRNLCVKHLRLSHLDQVETIFSWWTALTLSLEDF